MYGLGKERSVFGKFVDDHKISHGELVRISGVSKDTVTKACSKNEPLRDISKDALIAALRKITGKALSKRDFWE
ncbi:hypothetical protein EV294_101322 [Paenibacillus sp. BK033]|nr:hypothetical protein EV294_101322 [Paenibacillus sp. BK033]